MGSLRSILLGGALGCLACGGGSEPDTDPGLVSVELATPYQDDGAILFQVSGGAVSGVAPVPGLEATHTSLPGGITSVLVRGPLSNGVILRLELPDRNRMGRYSLIVLQAAARSYTRRSPGSYALHLLPP